MSGPRGTRAAKRGRAVWAEIMPGSARRHWGHGNEAPSISSVSSAPTAGLRQRSREGLSRRSFNYHGVKQVAASLNRSFFAAYPKGELIIAAIPRLRRISPHAAFLKSDAPVLRRDLEIQPLENGIAPGRESLASFFTVCCRSISAPRTFAGEMKPNVRHAASVRSGTENQQGNRP